VVDRRVRYLNPNGKIPAPGGGTQLLEELKPPALSDLQIERVPAVRPGAFEEAPVVAPVKSAAVNSGKNTRVNGKDVPDISPEPAAWLADQKETPRLEQNDPQQGVPFPESDRRKGIAGHSGVVLTFGRVEALQTVRSDSREKTVKALRQLAESVSSGDMPWELLQADYDGTADLGERSWSARRRPRGSREVGLRHADQSDQFAEIVVPLAKGIVRGRALVACPGWFLLMLIFLAATCLALIAEQGLLSAGLFTHFLDSKAWVFIKLALISPAALAALRGLFYSFFTKPHRNSKAKPL
jgi:hypothetical protein